MFSCFKSTQCFCVIWAECDPAVVSSSVLRPDLALHSEIKSPVSARSLWACAELLRSHAQRDQTVQQHMWAPDVFSGTS